MSTGGRVEEEGELTGSCREWQWAQGGRSGKRSRTASIKEGGTRRWSGEVATVGGVRTRATCNAATGKPAAVGGRGEVGGHAGLAGSGAPDPNRGGERKRWGVEGIVRGEWVCRWALGFHGWEVMQARLGRPGWAGRLGWDGPRPMGSWGSYFLSLPFLFFY